MSGRAVLRLFGLTAAVAVAPGAIAAQQIGGGIIVTPYMGVYVPTNDIAAVAVSEGGSSLRSSIKHQTALVSGLNVSYWLSNHLGVEAGGAYTKSGINASATLDDGTGPIAATGSQYAHVWLGSAKLMVQWMSQTSNLNFRLGLGPAIVSRAGAAYASDAESKITGKTDVGGVVSLCSRLPVSNLIAIRLRAEDYMYKGKLGYESTTTPSDNFTFDSRFQHDLVFTAGLQLFLNR